WLPVDAPNGSDEMLPALSYQVGILGLTWFDSRNQMPGDFAVFGTSSNIDTSNFIPAKQQVNAGSIYNGNYSYMGLASWAQNTFYFGASYTANNLWLAYATDP